MQIKEGTTTFQMHRKGDELPPAEELTDGDDFPRFKLVPVEHFATPVTNPVALLRGFDVEFEPDADEGEGRPFGHLDVRVAVEDVTAGTVIVRVTFGLRDWSGDWNDEHAATVNFAVLAD